MRGGFELMDGLSRGAGLMVDHLWQATLFAGVVLLVLSVLPRAPARLRHSLYLLASLKFLLPSALVVGVLTMVGATGFVGAPPFAPPAFLGSLFDLGALWGRIQALAGGTGSTGAEPASGWGPIWILLGGLWLSGSVVLLSRWILARRRFARILSEARASSRVDPRSTESYAVEARLQRLAGRLGLRRPVALALSPRVAEPGVWGILRPVVVLPQEVAAHLEAEELDAVLLHELIHVERWDNLIGDLHMVVCCLFWFHPLIWWLDRRLLRERERACDDQVVALSGASRVYVRGLMKVLRFGLGGRLAGVSSAGGSDLRRRIEGILAGDPGAAALRPRHRAAVAVVMVLLVLSSLGATGAGVVAAPPEPLRAMTAREALQRGGVDGGAGVVSACDLPKAPAKSRCSKSGEGSLSKKGNKGRSSGEAASGGSTSPKAGRAAAP